MALDLTDDETAALVRLPKRAIDNDRYPLAPRLDPLKAILAKIEPPREPRPPPKIYSSSSSCMAGWLRRPAQRPASAAGDGRSRREPSRRRRGRPRSAD